MVAMPGSCLLCKQFPGDHLSNYPPKLELHCEVIPGAQAQPVHVRVFMV